MPYIKSDRQKEVSVLGDSPATPGELNYLITDLCLMYAGSTPNYAMYNSIVGVLECAKLEFYRRAVAMYEDQKILENGDVYT